MSSYQAYISQVAEKIIVVFCLRRAISKPFVPASVLFASLAIIRNWWTRGYSSLETFFLIIFRLLRKGILERLLRPILCHLTPSFFNEVRPNHIKLLTEGIGNNSYIQQIIRASCTLFSFEAQVIPLQLKCSSGMALSSLGIFASCMDALFSISYLLLLQDEWYLWSRPML